MAIKTIDTILAELPFFAGLPAEHFKLITGCAKNVHFDAGTYIARESDPADEFFVIRHGQVALQLFAPGKGTVTIATLGDGDVLGWSWLVPPYQWSFDAEAKTLVRAIALDGECLRGKCDDDARLGYELMRRFAVVMVSRLQMTRLQLMDLYGNPDGERAGG
jgi:CRP/FNR family cyclic AMP-dependent transcriptional regulator